MTQKKSKAEAVSTKLLAQPERERSHFKALLLSNPNYFGNLQASKLKPVKLIASNRTYEELTCVGFNPEFNRLEATLRIKQNVGYNGDLCSLGSFEYVRFYLSYDNGVTWDDQGFSTVNVHDMTGIKPLDYAVYLDINPKKKSCDTPNLPLVRAILSWNSLPPANTPAYIPVWGNVEQARIQIAAKQFFWWGDLVEQLHLPQFTEPLFETVNPVASIQSPALNIGELHQIYEKTDVPVHRYAFNYLQPIVSKQAGIPYQSSMALGSIASKIDLSKAIDALLKTDGDISFEELTCIGFNTDKDMLEGIIRVKKPNGYSGDLCSAGSREYVAFWVDWGLGGGWSYAGGTSVKVVDLGADFPKDSLYYAVFLPIKTAEYQQACEKGAKIIKLRAILSWAVPPSSTNPNYVPTWGNREETHIQLKPSTGVKTGENVAGIEAVNNIPVGFIDSNGYVNGDLNGVLPGGEMVDVPFGGLLEITGKVTDFPPDVFGGGATPYKFKVLVRQTSPVIGSWQPIADSFYVGITEYINSIPTSLPLTKQEVDLNGWYTLRDDAGGGPNPLRSVNNKRLAVWKTYGLEGTYQIKIEALNPTTLATWTSNVVSVRLDNTAPTADFEITSGSGDCGDFNTGDIIEGTYATSDEHFGSMAFEIIPALGGSFTQPLPADRLFVGMGGNVPTGGASGTWRLDTTGMPRCGYALRYHTADRAIVGYYSDSISFTVSYTAHTNLKDVGLCLREG